MRLESLSERSVPKIFFNHNNCKIENILLDKGRYWFVGLDKLVLGKCSKNIFCAVQAITAQQKRMSENIHCVQDARKVYLTLVESHSMLRI